MRLRNTLRLYLVRSDASSNSAFMTNATHDDDADDALRLHALCDLAAAALRSNPYACIAVRFLDAAGYHDALVAAKDVCRGARRAATGPGDAWMEIHVASRGGYVLTHGWLSQLSVRPGEDA